MPKIIIELPESLYKSLEKYAMIRGVSIERVVIDELRRNIEYVRDIDSYYNFRSDAENEVFKIIMNAIEEKRVNIRVKERSKVLEKYVYPFGRFLAVIRELYGRIPAKISIRELKENPRLADAIKKHSGVKITDPAKWVDHHIVKIKRLSKIFKLSITGEGDDMIISFENPGYIEKFAGIGSRVMRRRIRR